jgi:tetratricopeptide (TPR) repeat protein
VGSEQARNLRRQGIAAAKAGQKDQARTLLQQSLRLEPNNEAAWIWLASIARDQRERLLCFQRILEINPQNETARNALQAMGLSPAQLAGKQPPAPAQSAAAQAEPAPQVPASGLRKQTDITQQVDEIIRAYQRQPDRLEGITWTRKSRGRAGERDSMVLRLYVAGGIIGILAAVLIIGGLIVWNTPSLRGIVFAPTWTPTFTPTLTPTSTPGFTPTPSPTPELTLTPSPTIDPDIPRGSIDAPPAPTRIYPEVSNRRLSDAIDLINRGEVAVALPTLVKEREATNLSFDAAPYYYEALALLRGGSPETALSRLREAESRLSEARTPGFKPLIDAGFAQVHLQLAKNAFEQGDTAQARDQLDAAELRAQLAIDADPLLVPAYLVLAERYTEDQDYEAALDILNDALSRPALKADTNLIVARGEVYFQQGELDLAAQEAFKALYIDPTIEEAYLLQIKTALARNDPGLAVIYAQNYLFFYPGSAAGFKLLGDARVAEGNIDLALAAYDQALAAQENTEVTVEALVARGKIRMQYRRYDLARQDFTQALALDNDPAIQALRMEAAYQGGNLSTALTDLENLRGTGAVPASALDLLNARILIDRASQNDTETLNRALDLLSGSLPSGSQPIASEYRARAQYLLGQYTDALGSVDAALTAAETGSRHFLRGQILEALEQPEQAVREYEWVVTWSEIYPYGFLPQARQRLRSLQQALSSGS